MSASGTLLARSGRVSGALLAAGGEVTTSPEILRVAHWGPAFSAGEALLAGGEETRASAGSLLARSKRVTRASAGSLLARSKRVADALLEAGGEETMT